MAVLGKRAETDWMDSSLHILITSAAAAGAGNSNATSRLAHAQLLILPSDCPNVQGSKAQLKTVT